MRYLQALGFGFASVFLLGDVEWWQPAHHSARTGRRGDASGDHCGADATKDIPATKR